MSFKDYLDGFDPLTRRCFVAGAAHSMLGLGAMPLLANAAYRQQEEPEETRPTGGTAKNVIYLFMSGGMSHLDTFDPKPDSDLQGPTESVKTSADDVLVASHFKNMARHMDKVCLLSGMSSTQGAHAQGRYYMHTSYELRGTIKHPSLGAWANRLAGSANPTLPGFVAVGGANLASAGFFPSQYVPLPIGDPDSGLQNSKPAKGVDSGRFDKRMERLAKMNQAFEKRHAHKKVRAYTEMYDQAVKLMGSRDLEAFDLSKEPDALRIAYGNDNFGQGCLLARRLVENGVRFVEVVSGGWDSHNENWDRMEEKCPPLDRTLATLLADLDARGLLEETLVVVATEFGRSPKINGGRNGRDHYPKAFTCMLAGGGVKGGLRYGKTDENGAEVIENRVLVPDLNATIAYGLGLPLDRVIYSPSKRPFTVADKGKPVTAVFA